MSDLGSRCGVSKTCCTNDVIGLMWYGAGIIYRVGTLKEGPTVMGAMQPGRSWLRLSRFGKSARLQTLDAKLAATWSMPKRVLANPTWSPPPFRAILIVQDIQRSAGPRCEYTDYSGCSVFLFSSIDQ